MVPDLMYVDRMLEERRREARRRAERYRLVQVARGVGRPSLVRRVLTLLSGRDRRPERETGRRSGTPLIGRVAEW
jgi:hypothetical protein